MTKVLVLKDHWLTFTPEDFDALNFDGKFQFSYKKFDEITPSDLTETEIILGMPKPESVKGFANLKWLQTVSAGVNGYDETTIPAGVILTNGSGTYDLTISEHMLMMALMLFRRYPEYAALQLKEDWRYLPGEIKSIAGSTIVVHGYGNIGQEFAKKAKALGAAKIIAVRNSVKFDSPYADEVVTSDALIKALPEADLVVTSVPGTTETENLFNTEIFKHFKKGAYFINVGRGTTVVLDDLLAALNTGQLAGAGLDVTNPEPLPKGHPAWTTPNLIITPHSSGGYALPETKHRLMTILTENFRRYATGEPLNNIVNLKKGY
jgi:phosphoglycerate dehydrogenase-like enzyme